MSALLRGITSKNYGDFYFLNCLHSFRTKNKLESHKRYVKIRAFVALHCFLKALRYWSKSDKITSIIYVDLKPLVKEVDLHKNDSKKSSTAKVGEHIPCGCPISTMWTFDGIENKHVVYRGEYCVKKFCESLKENAIKIINFEQKKITPLTIEQQESYEKAKICYICKNSLKINTLRHM